MRARYRTPESIGEAIPINLEASIRQSSANLESLFDVQRGQYYSGNHTTAALIYDSSVETLLPRYAGSISPERAQLLVKLMEDEYLSASRYPLPSVPPKSNWFEPKRYWQGPTWLNINWLVIDGYVEDKGAWNLDVRVLPP